MSRSQLPNRILISALKNMIKDGYLNPNATIEDVVDMAYSCCENISWYAEGKLIEWAD